MAGRVAVSGHEAESGVHYARTVLARYTFCGLYVPAVKVTSVRRDVTCAGCLREPAQGG